MLHENEEIRIDESEDRNPSASRFSFRSKVADQWIEVANDLSHQPARIKAVGIAAGVKRPGELDFGMVLLPEPGALAALFTRSLSASPAVLAGRQVLTGGQAQMVAVISKNANVYSPTGEADHTAIQAGLASAAGVNEQQVLLGSTGIIGVRLPVDRLLQAVPQLMEQAGPGQLDQFSQAIMTTDPGPKTCSVRFGDAVLCGVAKGAGMVEPNLATMLVYFFTNLAIPQPQLQETLSEVVGSTFNSLSVDADMSTSDTVALLADPEVPPDANYLADFRTALICLATKLTQDIAFQSEGATKLIRATVTTDRSEQYCRAAARNIINSPLVKTAIFGADPNWGRIVMAIGKPTGHQEQAPLDPKTVAVRIQGQTVYDGAGACDVDLAELSQAIAASKTVDIEVQIGTGKQQRATVWGCDLSYDYVRINAEYTT